MNRVKQKLHAQFLLIQGIREFFLNQSFIDVLTPPIVANPGMEPHIHPFEISSKHNQRVLNRYLHTSPEFHMKELLSYQFEKIFNINYCFRDEPDSPIHRNQFIMLEWYRACENYQSIMVDCEKLIRHCFQYLDKHGIKLDRSLNKYPMVKRSVRDLFFEFLNLDIFNYLEKDEIKNLIKTKFREIPLPKTENLSWDDYYFLLFLNKIEPELVRYPFLIIYEYPHHLSALATLKKSDVRVCERFELYIKGTEICNCYNELRDIETHKKRFKFFSEQKKRLYNYSLPSPDILYTALKRHFPPSAGSALGVERLLMALTNIKNPFWD